MVDSIEDLSSNDIQEKYTTYSNTLKKTVKDLYDLYNVCKSREDVNQILYCILFSFNIREVQLVFHIMHIKELFEIFFYIIIFKP